MLKPTLFLKSCAQLKNTKRPKKIWHVLRFKIKVIFDLIILDMIFIKKKSSKIINMIHIIFTLDKGES